jgi:hypothetical protein
VSDSAIGRGQGDGRQGGHGGPPLQSSGT